MLLCLRRQVVKRFGATHVLHDNAASKSADLNGFLPARRVFAVRMAENHVRQYRRHVPRGASGRRPDAKAGDGRQHHPDGFLWNCVVGQADLRRLVLSGPPDQQPGGVLDFQGSCCRVEPLSRGKLGDARIRVNAPVPGRWAADTYSSLSTAGWKNTSAMEIMAVSAITSMRCSESLSSSAGLPDLCLRKALWM
jgi:hypothetical protein